MIDLALELKKAKERRKQTRADLVRSEENLASLRARRAAGEQGLTPHIDRAKDTHDNRKADWKQARARLDRLQERKQNELATIKLDRNDGHSGIETFFFDYVDEFMAKQGLDPGSRVRSASHNADVGGSPNSDHLDAPNRYATDYPTYSGEAAARALAESLGIHSWSPNSYTSYTITVDGVRMVVQILWGAAIGHADHVHCGAHLA